jgi:hypothetical protein
MAAERRAGGAGSREEVEASGRPSGDGPAATEPASEPAAAGFRPVSRGVVARAVQVALTVLVTWFVLDRVGLSLAELARFDPGRWHLRWLPLAASCVVLAGGYALSSLLWRRMVRELGGPPLRRWTAVRIFMLANLGRYVPGKVLQIAGLAWLARREGVPGAIAAGAAVLGQGVALLGATLVGLGAFFGPNEAWRAWGWVGLAAVLAFVALASLPASARALERAFLRLARTPAPARAADPAGRPGFGLRWTLLYALNWGVYASAFWLLYLGLEGWTPFLRAGPAFAAAYVAGYLAVFAPAGVGVREASLVVFLGPVLAPEPAAALAVVARLWTTAVELVPAAVLAWMHLRARRAESAGRGVAG